MGITELGCERIKVDDLSIFFRLFWNLDVKDNATIVVKNDDDVAETIVVYIHETIGDRLAFNLPSTGKFLINLNQDGGVGTPVVDYVNKC